MTKSNIIYGTLRECVNELWKRIDFDNCKFPDFDFAADVPGDCCDVDEAYQNASGWFGCKDFGKAFDCDTISVMIAHYCGGGIESMEIIGEYENEREVFMKRIGSSTDAIGYGVLDANDYTVFEII